MKKVFLISFAVVFITLIWFLFFRINKNYIYKGNIQTPVYLENSNSLAFIDCKQECKFHIFSLSSESITKTIENVDNAGLKYYSPNLSFIIGKNNGHTLIGYSLQNQGEFKIDINPEEFVRSLVDNGNKFKDELFYSLNQFDSNRFVSPKMFCFTSSTPVITIPNKLGTKINYIRKVKNLGLAGQEITYFLQINGKETLLRTDGGECLVSPDNSPDLYVIDFNGILKIKVK